MSPFFSCVGILLLLSVGVCHGFTSASFYGTWDTPCSFVIQDVIFIYATTTYTFTSPNTFKLLVDTYALTGTCSSNCCPSADLAFTVTITGTYSVSGTTLTTIDNSRKITFYSDTGVEAATQPPFSTCLNNQIPSLGQTVDITNNAGCADLDLPLCPSGITVNIISVSATSFKIQGRSNVCTSNATSTDSATKQQNSGGSASQLLSWASFAPFKLEA